MNSVDKKLINFRCELDVLDMFDEICDFKRVNRSQILISLMRKFISEGRDEIAKWNVLREMGGKNISHTHLNRF
tara:strand:+ start:244 stop:465 length:222 start_codon:yes stop_codon:yes gene_type:complete